MVMNERSFCQSQIARLLARSRTIVTGLIVRRVGGQDVVVLS